MGDKAATGLFCLSWLLIFSLFPLGLSPLGVLFGFFIFLNRRWRQEAKRFWAQERTLCLLALVLFGWMLFVSLLGLDPLSGVGTTLGFAIPFIFAFFSGSRFTRELRFSGGGGGKECADPDPLLFNLLAVVALFVAGFTIIDQYLYGNQQGNRGIFPGQNPNYTGTILFVVSIFALYKVIAAPTWRARFFPLLVFFFVNLGLWSSGSRGAFLGEVAFLGLTFMPLARKYPAAFILLSGAVLFALGKLLLLRGFGDPGRIKLWRFALQNLHPLWGWGVNCFGAAYKAMGGEHNFAHNIFLQFASDTGLLGLLFLLSLLGYLTWRGLRLYQRTRRLEDWCLLAGFLAFWIRDLVDVNIIYSGSIDALFWLIPGYLLAQERDGIRLGVDTFSQ